MTQQDRSSGETGRRSPMPGGATLIAVLVALIALVGTIISAYNNRKGLEAQIVIPATWTAQSQLTARAIPQDTETPVAMVALPETPSPVPTATLTPSATVAPAATPLATATSAPTSTSAAPLAAAPLAAAAIVFDAVPAINSDGLLQGHVSGVAPDDYKVAVYINVAGWWTKPFVDQPLTAIGGDGRWTADVTTGGADASATDIVAFLVPNGFTPPLGLGESSLSPEISAAAVARTSATRRPARTLTFAGRTWQVEYAPIAVGSGPNLVSDDAADVWVDASGYLHLKIALRDGRWYSTEVICTDPLAYGAHTITLGSRVDAMDDNAVLGFFTWDSNAPPNYREMDIEFSRFGAATGPNAHYSIQPWKNAANVHRFDLSLTGDESVHRFDWRPERVQFDSQDGTGAPLQSWTYADPAQIPPDGGGHVRINLWLFDGEPPADGRDVEVIVKSYEFAPANP